MHAVSAADEKWSAAMYATMAQDVLQFGEGGAAQGRGKGCGGGVGGRLRRSIVTRERRRSVGFEFD